MGPAVGRRIMVIIPGFGHPDLGRKVEILQKNMSVLPEGTAYMILNHNANPEDIPNSLLNDPRIAWKHGAGAPAWSIHNHAVPEEIREAGYTHVMILLDGMELLNMVHPDQLDLVMDRYKMDILSPTLLHAESTHMIHNPNTPTLAIRSQTVVELFCYYMRIGTYDRYYRYIDPSNAWMWGMDLVLSEYLGFGMAVMNMWIVHDHSPSQNSPYNDAKEEQTMLYVGRYDPTLTMEGMSLIPRTISEVSVQELLYISCA